MPDLDLIKQGEQAARDGRGRFAKRRRGNAAGRGPRRHINCAVRLVLAREGLTRKAIESGRRRATRARSRISAARTICMPKCFCGGDDKLFLRRFSFRGGR